MDGLAKTKDAVFILAATNLPWDLDTAMLRRLEKRILVGMPDLEARCEMFKNLLIADECETEMQYVELAESTAGYSGSDISLVCREAAMRPLRKLFDVLESHENIVHDMSIVKEKVCFGGY